MDDHLALGIELKEAMGTCWGCRFIAYEVTLDETPCGEAYRCSNLFIVMLLRSLISNISPIDRMWRGDLSLNTKRWTLLLTVAAFE
jgi:hypothetical protein